MASTDPIQANNPASGQLPPGQVETRKWPVTGEREPSPEALDRDRWRLRVNGLVDCPLELRLDEFLALAQRELVADIHCVTGWSHFGMRFTGLPLADLLERVGVLPNARFVRFEAYSARGHDTSLELEVARASTWLVHARDGVMLDPEHGGPVRSVTPSRYFYKSLKWVQRVELLAEDRLGYWERESRYHNNADWRSGQERYTSGSIRPERIAAFRNATDYARYRGPANLLLNVDLSGWSPASTDLRGLHVKNSNLRGARLTDVDLRDSNLTRCDFAGADLRGADLRGADLEGARFCGADLRGADVSGAALSAAIFDEAGRPPALVAGLRWIDVSGLLESQEAFLRASS